MTKGRKLLPDSVKKTRGTLKKCREVEALNLSVSDQIPQPPVEFTDLERSLWFDVTNELFNAGLLQKIGLAPIQMYCTYLSNAIEAENIMRKKGRVFAKLDNNGNKIPHISPYHRISMENFAAAARLMTEFGITPSGQAKIASLIKARKEEEKNELDELLED